MITAPARRLVPLVPLALLVACGTESPTLPFETGFEITAHRSSSDWSPWSEPVNLGPVINSSAGDMNATLSPDERSLYLVSDRLGTLGLVDIWVSRRACRTCPWQAPVNLGEPINSAAADGAPTLSDDGRLLFFFSGRPGGVGGTDLYVSRRVDADEQDEGDEDDRGQGEDEEGENEDNEQITWGPPVNLGPDVNTASAEQGSYYVRYPGSRTATLYFNRVGPGGSLDVYAASLGRDGLPLGPAVAASDINDATGADQKVTVRSDGRELLLSSNRSGSLGTLGFFDIWVFTRRSLHDPWGNPTNLGSPVNTPEIDSQPSLSRDGRVLILTSNRLGSLGGNDLWMSTRTRSGQDEDDDDDRRGSRHRER